MKRRRESQEGSTALGLRIKKSRTDKGMTQTELATKADCTKGAVSQWEKGDVINLRIERLFKVADALGVDARWLATGQGERLSAAGMKLEIGEAQAAKNLRTALPAWRRYVLSLAMITDQQRQQLFLDMLTQHVPDEKVAAAYGSAPHTKEAIKK